MSDEQTLEQLLEEIIALKDYDALPLVRKVYKNWTEGVIPNQAEIIKLKKYLQKDGPCERLTDSGHCSGWLRKNASSLDFPVYPPYACPFVDKQDKPAKWRECPGYRSIKQS